MKSKATTRINLAIRMAMAVAIAFAIAFAFALCLPTSAAFAVDEPMKDAPATAGQDASAPADDDNVDPVRDENVDAVDDEDVDSADDENADLVVPADAVADGKAGTQQNRETAEATDSDNRSTMNAASVGGNDLAAAAAASASDWDSETKNGTVILNHYIGDDTTEIVVPSMIDNLPVVIDRGAFKNRGLQDTLEKVVFEGGVKIKNASLMFEGFKALETVEASELDLSECTDIHNMFIGCVALTKLDVSKWNVGNVTNMSNMFNGCGNLTALDVSNWDVSNVTNMREFFHNCENLAVLDVSNWDVGNVENMFCMFSGCESLTSLNVSNWNTSHVTNMGESFRNCENLATLDVSGWNVGNVENMAYAFQFCKALSALDVSNWDVRKVTTFRSAFEGMPATTVLDLTKWEALSVQEFAVHEDGKWETSGWQRAFRGPLLLVNDGQMKQRLASPNSDGKYIGFDVHGSYGVFLEDSMERVWCLNYGVPTPAGNAFAKYSKHLDEEGLAFLETLVADTEMDKAERWKKIAAAITFFGNVINSQVQDDLQDTIWYYSDNLVDAKSRKKATPNESTQKMIDYVEAHWQELDYSKAVINFYDSETEPTKPTKVDPETGNWNLDGKFQNMISLTTAASIIRKDLGSIVISKEIATKSDANTDTTFTFTVRLTGADGKPLATSVSAASEGEDLHSVTPKDGVIILTTTGEGEACIHNLPVGTAYTITEASLEGWLLVGTSNAKGTVAEGVTLTATFTNDRAEAKTSATIKKIWDDEGDLDKLRPASITVTLSNGTTVTLSEDNDWTATITDLPKYDASGKLIEYTWTEGDMPEGYVLADTSVDGTMTTLTNAHKREEKAEAKETKAENASSGKGAGSAGGMAQTGDDLPAWPLAICALVSLLALTLARRKQRSC